MGVIIEAEELSRWYGIVMGLNNVSFRIHQGITGVVGPNGAGKSTLIGIITGQLKVSSGVLTVYGEAPWNNPRLLGRIGYCPEKDSLPKDLKPQAWLCSLGMISGLSSLEAKVRSEQMLDTVKLGRPHWKKKMKQFSKGMRQRVKLAQALMHKPDLLVLDEPMNGLDPMGRQEIAGILKRLAAEGTDILISSHILNELESICREILILNWGRILASGSQDNIQADIKQWSEELSIRCDQPEQLVRRIFDTGVLKGFHMDLLEDRLYIRIGDAEAFHKVWLDVLRDSGLNIYEIRSESRSLKQIFDKVTG